MSSSSPPPAPTSRCAGALSGSVAKKDVLSDRADSFSLPSFTLYSAEVVDAAAHQVECLVQEKKLRCCLRTPEGKRPCCAERLTSPAALPLPHVRASLPQSAFGSKTDWRVRAISAANLHLRVNHIYVNSGESARAELGRADVCVGVSLHWCRCGGLWACRVGRAGDVVGSGESRRGASAGPAAPSWHWRDVRLQRQPCHVPHARAAPPLRCTL